jgi:spermidine synthase
MKNVLIYITVFIAGSSVLCLEILGTRILAPYFGTSIYVWTALISVTLLSLSLGYFIGGILADRRLSFTILSYLLFAAGLSVLLLPLISGAVIGLIRNLELRLAVIAGALLIFVIPLTILGTVSPYVIKLRADSMENVGRSAGSLYSLSTVGSVIAAVLTGYVLVPNIGISNLIILTGIFLFLTAVLNILYEKTFRQSLALLGILIISAILLSILNLQFSTENNSRIVETLQSPYGEISVVDEDGARYLLIDGAVHSAIDLSNGRSFDAYVDVIDLAASFYESPGRALLIGLGGGNTARNYAAMGWQVNAVEIDPAVIDLAYKYFGLKEEEAEVYAGDGREFLYRTDKKYELIILDAYGTSTIPFHLVSQEVFNLAKSKMSSNGIIAINVQSIGWKSEIVNTIGATLASVFRNVLVLPIVEPPNKFGNLIIVASDSDIELKQKLPAVQSRLSSDYNKAHAWDNRFAPETNRYRVLTDNLNNIDVLSEEASIASRTENLEYFMNLGIIK